MPENVLHIIEMYYFESVTDLCVLSKVAVRTNWDCKHFYLPIEWTHLLYILSNWHCPTNVSLDCEQSLFFFRFSDSNARAWEWRSRETRETCLSLLTIFRCSLWCSKLNSKDICCCATNHSVTIILKGLTSCGKGGGEVANPPQTPLLTNKLSRLS